MNFVLRSTLAMVVVYHDLEWFDSERLRLVVPMSKEEVGQTKSLSWSWWSSIMIFMLTKPSLIEPIIGKLLFSNIILMFEFSSQNNKAQTLPAKFS